MKIVQLIRNEEHNTQTASRSRKPTILCHRQRNYYYQNKFLKTKDEWNYSPEPLHQLNDVTVDVQAYAVAKLTKNKRELMQYGYSHTFVHLQLQLRKLYAHLERNYVQTNSQLFTHSRNINHR